MVVHLGLPMTGILGVIATFGLFAVWAGNISPFL
jgi:hypothetical protein